MEFRMEHTLALYFQFDVQAFAYDVYSKPVLAMVAAKQLVTGSSQLMIVWHVQSHADLNATIKYMWHSSISLMAMHDR
jgi:hypothetical protein